LKIRRNVEKATKQFRVDDFPALMHLPTQTCQQERFVESWHSTMVETFPVNLSQASIGLVAECLWTHNTDLTSVTGVVSVISHLLEVKTTWLCSTYSLLWGSSNFSNFFSHKGKGEGFSVCVSHVVRGKKKKYRDTMFLSCVLSCVFVVWGFLNGCTPLQTPFIVG